jgi:F0F1-type ATP synthase assembly protein I
LPIANIIVVDAVKSLNVKRPIFIMRAASTSLLRKNSAIAAVLQTQVVLGLCCCVGFLLLDVSFGKGALAGFASVFVPSSVMAWQQSRTTQAPRMLGQSVVKMVMTAAFMAASFGVWAVNPVSFFITFVITQVSYLVALVAPTTGKKQ